MVPLLKHDSVSFDNDHQIGATAFSITHPGLPFRSEAPLTGTRGITLKTIVYSSVAC
jgi:hypothetical protein